MSTAEGGYKSGSVYISSGSSVSIDSFLNYEITKLSLLSLILYDRLNVKETMSYQIKSFVP